MKDFTINTIALRYMKTHRRQYVTLTLSIVLALFFTAMLLVFWQSMTVSLYEQHVANYGKQDMIIENLDKDSMQKLEDAGFIQSYGESQILSYVFPDKTSEEHLYSLATYDDTAAELANYSLISGRMPEKPGEIAMEDYFLRRFFPGKQEGDIIELFLRTPDGQGSYLKGRTKAYTVTGVLNDRRRLLEASVDKSADYEDLPAGYLSQQEVIEAGGKPVCNYYACCTEAFKNVKTPEDLLKFPSLEGIRGEIEEGIRIDKEELYGFVQYDWDGCAEQAFEGVLPENDISLFSTKYGDDYIGGDESFHLLTNTSKHMALFAIVLIAAACIGIVNAFAENLSGRQQQIGMLRAIAATKRQIRQIFGREALALALVSIVPATGLACLAVYGILRLFGPSFHLVLNGAMLVAVMAAGLLCILLAVYVPLWWYSRIPPMQAVRNAALSRRMHRKKLRSKKRFSVPSHFARRQLRLYRGSQLGTMTLVALGMVALSSLLYTGALTLPEQDWIIDFRVGSSYVGNSVNATGLVEDSENPGLTEGDKQEVAALPTVERVYGDKWIDVHVIPEQITDYMLRQGAGANQSLEYLIDEEHRRLLFAGGVGAGLADVTERRKLYLYAAQQYGYTKDYYLRDLQAYDHIMLEELQPRVLEGEINLDKLDSGEEVLVIAPTYGFWYETKRSEEEPEWYGETVPARCKEENVFKNDMFHAGDKLTVSYLYSTEPFSGDTITTQFQRQDKEVTIGAVLTFGDKPRGKEYWRLRWDSFDVGGLITSVAGMEAMGYNTPYRMLDIVLSEYPSPGMEQYLMDSLKAIAVRTQNVSVSNELDGTRKQSAEAYSRFLANVAIVILVFSASVCLVNNSFSARIQSGKRSVGILRALGASSRDITRMYMIQLMRMIGMGTLLGLSVEAAILLPYRHHQILGQMAGAYRMIPIWQPLVFAALLLLLCSLLTRHKLRVSLKSSIVENIREL